MRSMRKRALLGATALAALASGAAPSFAWEPAKAVELVVTASAGGATDQMARMLQSIIQKYSFVKQPIVVTLKPGGSGAEGLIYTKDGAGDPHRLVLANSQLYTLPLAAKIPFNWRELTPVTIAAFDQFILWNNAEAPQQTVKDFIDAARNANPPFKMGGTGSKREDNILTAFIEKKTGAKFAYLPYKGGGEAATQLVGKHTESNVNNPSENAEVWRAGQVRALCVFDSEPIPYKAKITATQAWSDIPTCKSQGLDIEYTMVRTVFLPGKVDKEAQAFYIELFKKIAQTSEFKEYIEKQALKPSALYTDEMVKFLEKDEALHTQLMTEAGFVAK